MPVHYAVLLPPVEVIIRRAAEREKRIARVDDSMFTRVHAMCADAPDLPGWRIDNSSMTAQQTADAVMEACERGDCLVWSPR